MRIKPLILAGLIACLVGPMEGLTQAPQDGAQPQRGRRGRNNGQPGNPGTPGQDSTGGGGGGTPGFGGGGPPGPGGGRGRTRGPGGPGGNPFGGPPAMGMGPGSGPQGQPQRPGSGPIIVEDDTQDVSRPVVYRAGNLPMGMEWFGQLDRDRDGQISLYEWKSAGLSMSQFAKLDLNDDGFITVEEVLRIQGPRRAGATFNGGIGVDENGNPIVAADGTELVIPDQSGRMPGFGRTGPGGPGIPGMNPGRQGRGGRGGGGGGGRGGRGSRGGG